MWKLNILPKSVCYSRQICPEVTEILDNERTQKIEIYYEEQFN